MAGTVRSPRNAPGARGHRNGANDAPRALGHDASRGRRSRAGGCAARHPRSRPSARAHSITSCISRDSFGIGSVVFGVALTATACATHRGYDGPPRANAEVAWLRHRGDVDGRVKRIDGKPVEIKLEWGLGLDKLKSPPVLCVAGRAEGAGTSRVVGRPFREVMQNVPGSHHVPRPSSPCHCRHHPWYPAGETISAPRAERRLGATNSVGRGGGDAGAGSAPQDRLQGRTGPGVPGVPQPLGAGARDVLATCGVRSQPESIAVIVSRPISDGRCRPRCRIHRPRPRSRSSTRARSDRRSGSGTRLSTGRRESSANRALLTFPKGA